MLHTLRTRLLSNFKERCIADQSRNIMSLHQIPQKLGIQSSALKERSHYGYLKLSGKCV